MALVSFNSASITVDITGGVSLSPIPSIAITPYIKYLEATGAVKDQNVNGSVTPVNFDFAPATGQGYYIEQLTFSIDDGGTSPPNAYGGIAGGLTNGVQIILHVSGVDYEIINLKNNSDILVTFSESIQVAGGSFLNFSKGFAGKISFATNITLNGTNGDYIRMRVRDNLTSIDFQRAAVQVFQVLPEA